jgi:hypothetical protein
MKWQILKTEYQIGFDNVNWLNETWKIQRQISIPILPKAHEIIESIQLIAIAYSHL